MANSISNAKAHFEKLMDDDPHKSTGLAAIETLMETLANTQATNVQTLTTELQKTVDELISTDRSTASIKSAAELFLRFISLVKTEQIDGENFDKLMATYKHRGSQFIRRISQSKALISKFATPFIQHNAKLLTHSYSKIVLSALLEAKGRGHVFQVFVTESAPDFSGRKMNAALTEHGIDSTLVLDGAVGYLMERVDSVLLGAEAILENGGIINKIGSLGISISAKEFKKNVYVLAESIKFAKEFPINQRDIHESFKYRTSTLKNSDSLKYEHPLIDYTPPAYITLIISDLGILPPAKICDELLNMVAGESSSSAVAESLSSGADTRSESRDSSSESDAPTRVLRSAKRQASVEVVKHKRTRTIIDEAVTSESVSVDSREGSCEQSECASDNECCVKLSSNCVSTQSNRIGRANYFHLSNCEHICYGCYEDMARGGRTVNDQYVAWKDHWVQQSRCAPSLRIFALDALLPFWISCNKCGKFRKTSTDENQWTNESIADFTCDKLSNTTCNTEEDKKVANARDLTWIQSASAPTFLHNSPALYFLKDEYYVDEVGLSPNKAVLATLPEAKASSFMVPFNVPTSASVAFCVRPDGMEYDELQSFPEFSTEPVPYFAMRNLIVALWALNPFEYLTFEKCLQHLICRGLARVWFAEQLKRIYEYLLLKNLINYGIFPFTSRKLIKEHVPRKTLEVIVVGGGISGLCTARQLQMKGARVTVLEAKAECGGRMKDDTSLGVAVGCGAQLITGVTNNPIILMCEQLGVEYRRLSDECPLLDAATGRVISPSTDRVVDEHFNCLLDAIGEWRRVTNNGDASLLEKITGFHHAFIEGIDFPWSKDYDRVLNWQIGNIEFSCGSRLCDVSARHWDQNEALGQFAGDHALLSEGSGRIIAGLASGLDVRHKHAVNRVEYARKGKKAAVICENGKRFTCDKIVFCLPLAVYQKKFVEFSPPLPATKLDALSFLGAGLIEKIAVRFPRRFWSSLLKKSGNLDYFGHIPKNEKNRGLFNIFYDFSSRNDKNPKYVLMSYVCGETVELVSKMTNDEVIELFVNTLRDLFPDETIPPPIASVVTSWRDDPHIGMSYSYVKIGGNGGKYDQMAEPVNDQLYFAGECTSRFFPQTMTGSYVSGLREASRIAEAFILENERS